MRGLVSIVLVLLVVIPLAFSFLTYAFFWYEAANGPHRARLAQISRGRIRRLVARGILSSAISIVPVILLYPFGYRRMFSNPPEDAQCPLPPVILVHGLYHNSSAWMYYRFRLRRAGYKNIYTLNYNSFRRSFHEILVQLDELVSSVSGRFPERPIMMIGHSLGGLLCRAYCHRPKVVRVGAVITLGTPHQGSKLAVLGIGRLVQGIVYRGPLIAEMEQRPEPSEIPRLALHSPLDNMVLPNEALHAAVPGWEHRETSPVSHVAMLFHKCTASDILDYLRSLTDHGRTRNNG